MGLFSDLISTAVNVATLPLSVVADVVDGDPTLSHTAHKFDKLSDNADDIADDLANMDLL